jgi:hypothetical protein
MKKPKRTEQIHLRCTPKEARRFKRVAQHYGVGVATMIRTLVRDEAIAIKRENA